MEALGPGVEVVCDINTDGVWPTARRAWLNYPKTATHRLVIQDDVFPCVDFLTGAAAALAARPDVPVSFYANRQAIGEAREKGVHWAAINDGCWGQAMCLPTTLIPSLMEWVDHHIDPSFKHDDTRITMWCLETGQRVWCTAPSLVEHIGAAHSILGQSNKNRVARWFIGADESALSIPWETPGHVKGPGSTIRTFYKKYQDYFLEVPASLHS